MNKQIKIIKSWGKLRHPDKKFTNMAIALYYTLSEKDKEAMLKECKDYIEDVRSGKIEASVPELPTPTFKPQLATDNLFVDSKQLADYYNGK
jgi:hypothetical protein